MKDRPHILVVTFGPGISFDDRAKGIGDLRKTLTERGREDVIVLGVPEGTRLSWADEKIEEKTTQMPTAGKDK